MPARYQTIRLSTLDRVVDKYGQWKQIPTVGKIIGCEVIDARSDFVVDEKAGTRVYQDLTNFRVRNSALMRDVAINNERYTINWRNKFWKVKDVKESNW